MQEQDIKITFVGMEPTDALREYVVDKIMKKENLLTEATSIEVFFKESTYTRGVANNFRVDINVNLPETPVRVEESGENMYANVDKAMDILARRLNRYGDMREHWTGKKPWKVMEAEAALEVFEDEEDKEDYTEYVPKIATRKTIQDMSPLEEAEAIERMELSGYDQLLFRSKKTDKISMVYKRKQGGYGLVEPAEGV